jgi:hypothetical protein
MTNKNMDAEPLSSKTAIDCTLLEQILLAKHLPKRLNGLKFPVSRGNIKHVLVCILISPLNNYAQWYHR